MGVILLLVLLFAGRAAAAQEAGDPAQDALQLRIGAVAHRLIEANLDLCPVDLCGVTVLLMAPDEVDLMGGGEIADPRTNLIAIGPAVANYSEDNLARAVARMIAHLWLRHDLERLGEIRTRMNDAADCFGAVLAERTGFDVAAGVRDLRAQGDRELDNYADLGRRIAIITAAAARAAALAASGGAVDRAAIREFCGAGP